MMLRELLIKNRTYRRFVESRTVERETLEQLVELTRYCASASNRQLLRYLITNSPADNQKVYDCLGWAASLVDWDGPEPGQRPSAYLVMLSDSRMSKNIFCDDGIAAQTILLGATEIGLGGCMLAAVERNELREAFRIPEYYGIPMVIALGYPDEKVVMDESGETDPLERPYWRDEEGTHYVPKRPLSELLVDFD